MGGNHKNCKLVMTVCTAGPITINEQMEMQIVTVVSVDISIGMYDLGPDVIQIPAELR